MSKFKKKPVVIDAIRWMGGDYGVLNEFCGRNWGRADAVGSESWPSDMEDKEQVMIYNMAEQAWLPLPTRWWLIRGVQGELYPCKHEIFAETYEPV